MSAQDPDFVTGDHFDRTIGLVLDRLEAVEGKQMTSEQLQASFAAGLRIALTDQELIEDVMSKIVVTAQRAAVGQIYRNGSQLMVRIT